MTTREIAQELYNRKFTNTADVNNARPRITELVAVYRETTEEEKMIAENM